MPQTVHVYPNNDLIEHDSSFDDVADVLIRELGLQAHLAKRIINGKPDQWVRRHVTD